MIIAPGGGASELRRVGGHGLQFDIREATGFTFLCGEGGGGCGAKSVDGVFCGPMLGSS